ncbi:ABC transporter permease [Alteromonas ponticola]|uniref:ABC transporter permease n=1 Tax=Alteromonas aquimaris TaxID=2998417 RepID=A0ABT3PAV8_9ALTE|nr:FtsX-like permease family protein [Alteromonas aquimaris]MCW8109893.1 ABC transporter permease [Alteromonas aquimaris]
MAPLINDIRLVLASHLAFYYRHPWLIALFILGLSLGSALLTAIAGLNHEAHNRFQESSALIGNPISHFIKPLTGKTYIDGELWVHLRRLGFTQAQPVLRGSLQTRAGRSLAIQGVNTLHWLNRDPKSASAQARIPLSKEAPLYSAMVDKQFTSRLFTPEGHPIPLVLGKKRAQPDIRLMDNIGLWAITDLATADYLLQADGQLSFIELSHLTEKQARLIEQAVAGKAQLVEAENQDFTILSEAFFFNLTALALLGYIVAAFLSFNAIKLSLSSRKSLLKQLFLLGCSKRGITAGLVIELFTLSLLTATLGTLCGYVISNALIVDINRTLVGLYQFDHTLVIHWRWSNVVLGFILNLIALMVIMLAQIPRFVRFRKPAYYVCLLASVVGGIGLFLTAATSYQALLLCFCVLIIFVMLVPKILQALVSYPVSFSRPLYGWLYADSRYHLTDLHIAIVAIVVALGSAISMQIMVNSFAITLDNHLEKQLSADIYLRTSQRDRDLRYTLSQQPEIARLNIYQQSSGHVDNIPATLESYGETPQHYRHISVTSGSTVGASQFHQGGCLANEQSAIKYGLTLGQTINFTQNTALFTCRISEFFYDYGNPGIRVLILESTHEQSDLNTVFFGYSLWLNPAYSGELFSERLVNEFAQDSTQIYPNQRFKRYASELFNDTFFVTKILNGFIFAIALLSLCTSLLSLSENQLKQLSILHELGVTRTQLCVIKLMQTTLIVSIATLLTLPLGFALGYVLLKFVMPIAFGWTIHFHPDMNALFTTCFTLIGVSAICAYFPIRKLTKFEVRAR